MLKDHLLSQSFIGWKDLVEDLGESSYRESQLKNWIYKQNEMDFRNMTNLPAEMVEKLENKFYLNSLDTEKIQLSKDGTCKWLFSTADNLPIESVMIPDEGRNTVCISSQAGCGMGCRFCSTAKMGFIRNLTLGEISEQFLLVQKYLEDSGMGRLTNVVFMGMGEPLQNAAVVAEACDIFTDPKLCGIAPKRITVSTSGLVPEILKWANSNPRYKLALSLNGADNNTRSNLMPVNKSYSIEKLMPAVERYTQITGHKITLEYILIKDQTCTASAAHALKKLLRGKSCKVNLIPLNAGGQEDLQTPSEMEMNEFFKIVSSGNFPVMLRRPRGADIAAACGQLVQPVKKAA